jgi:hypothetical protein
MSGRTATRAARLPMPDDVVFVGRTASVQFDGASGFNFRIIRVTDQSIHAGWVWLDGVQLGPDGDAIERREIFVRSAGLRPATGTAATGTTTTGIA